MFLYFGIFTFLDSILKISLFKKRKRACTYFLTVVETGRGSFSIPGRGYRFTFIRFLV